ncbi:MAG: hypothetical protein K5654_05575 [Lachnospiraceae bacterium]|nr:hypothetical protein [Lachnospiraceae bacterium]
MKREDNLYTSQLEAKCRSAIKLLEEDNAELESLKEKINTIVSDEKNKGNSSNKLKNYLKDFYIIVGLTIETNNSSIDDLKELIVELSESQDYDGSLIWTCYERNKKAMTEHRMLAFKARLLEVAWSAPWILVAGVWSQSKISNPYTAEVEKYTSMANAEEELMNIFKGKMEDFDSFNARTSEYLFDGNELRNTIGNTLRQIIMQKEEGTYVPGVAVICLRNLALSNNKECNMASAKVIESDEYGQCLIDSKFHDNPDVRELENINSQMESYDNMVNSGNTAASEAAKKHMNPNQMSSRKKEVIRKILQKTNHSEEYVRTFDEVSEEFDCNQLEELMWHWIKVDDMPSLEGVEIPYSWSEEVKRDASFVRWMSSKGYDNEKISYYYDEHILGCATVLDSLTGSCICEEEWRVASTNYGKGDNVSMRELITTIRVLVDSSKEVLGNGGTLTDVKDEIIKDSPKIPGKVINKIYSCSNIKISDKANLGELPLELINEQYKHNKLG